MVSHWSWIALSSDANQIALLPLPLPMYSGLMPQWSRAAMMLFPSLPTHTKPKMPFSSFTKSQPMCRYSAAEPGV